MEKRTWFPFVIIWPSKIYLATALGTDGSDLFLSLAEISKSQVNHDSIRIYQNIGDSCPLQKSHAGLQIPKAPWDKSTKNGLLWSRAGTLQGSLHQSPTVVPRFPEFLRQSSHCDSFSSGLLEVPIKKDANKKQW